MALHSNKSKNSVADEQLKTQTTINIKNTKTSGKKPRRSLWRRIINFTFEPPKRVIYENGELKLIPLLPGKSIEEKLEQPVTAAPGKAVIEEKVEVITPPPPPPTPPKAVTPERVVEEEKLRKGLEKTHARFWSRLKSFFSFKRKIDESVLEELEDILISADVGVKPVQNLMEKIQEAWQNKTLTETSQIYEFLKTTLKEELQSWKTDIRFADTSPTVIMVVGVNGVGKTTFIAKLSNLFIKEGKKVLVAASDTFRAAAVDQLTIWSKRIGAEIVKHQTGSDPAAVAFDALEASIARGIDIVIVDTAGRLHTHENLMNELSKIKRVITKKLPDAPHEVLMVLDATTGQNAISQAKMFKRAVDVTGILLAKLDGTAKGGIVLGMCNETKIPVKYVGLGEKAEDIEKFDPEMFIDTLLEQ